MWRPLSGQVVAASTDVEMAKQLGGDRRLDA